MGGSEMLWIRKKGEKDGIAQARVDLHSSSHFSGAVIPSAALLFILSATWNRRMESKQAQSLVFEFRSLEQSL